MKMSRLFFFLPLLVFVLVGGAGCLKKSAASPDALCQDALKRAKDGQWAEAAKLVDKAAQADPANAAILTFQAICDERQGKEDEAVKKLTKAVSLDPKSFLASYCLGRLRFYEGQYELAFDALSNANATRPDDLNGQILLFQCAAELRNAKAVELFKTLSKAPAFKGKPECYNELAYYFIRGKNPTVNDKSLAAKALTSAYKLSSGNPTIVSNIAVYYDSAAAVPAKAKGLYRKFLQMTTSDPSQTRRRSLVTARLNATR